MLLAGRNSHPIVSVSQVLFDSLDAKDAAVIFLGSPIAPGHPAVSGQLLKLQKQGRKVGFAGFVLLNGLLGKV